MIAYIFYQPGTPGDRDIHHLADKLEERHIPVEMIDAASRKGVDLTELYDVVDRPAVVVVRDDATVQQVWQGTLPLVEDLAYYFAGA